MILSFSPDACVEELWKAVANSSLGRWSDLLAV
jgi:hypothetical protein